MYLHRSIDPMRDFSVLVDLGLGMFHEFDHIRHDKEPDDVPAGQLVYESFHFISCEEILKLSPEEIARLGMEEMFRQCQEDCDPLDEIGASSE